MDLLDIAKLWLSIGLIKKANVMHTHVFGPIQSDGHQYCETCGILTVASCIHKWKKEMEYTKTSHGRTVAIIYVLKCLVCGERKEHEIRS